ncbi:hypothetical protein RB25_11595 [Herbaspirillum rubrisubalbicans]|uniref:flagellar biosynthetic protein FliO n=1 Tax=Herbaspirillum rubrisubalbicans TaxID=80842 RepID=UPI000DC3E4CD|nr:flagellar biosynthetic protein FliO [Herbaspirillum rubrisubalbicans]RAN48422.1 hypothetical protein RB25_11595 [Herbaspirillum rubrisubalbicans]
MSVSSLAQSSPAQGTLALIPLRHDPEISTDAALFQALAIIVLLVILAAFLVWRQRRNRGRTSAHWAKWLKVKNVSMRLCLVQSTRLTPKSSVHVVQWDHKEWLLGCSEQGITLLGQRSVVPDDEIEVDHAADRDGGAHG